MGFALKLSSFFRAVTLAPVDGAVRKRFRLSERASAAVEFAIIGPVLILLMMGIFTYGGYFLTAHTIQQMANDAARSAIAGLDDEERLSLARASARSSLAGQNYMRGQISALEIDRNGNTLAVRVTYDASEDLYWSFESLLPTPAPEIARSATIRLGGV
jgi:Flp pilus assembly protein TadG